MMKKFLPELSYYCKGIVFYSLNNKYSNYSLLFPRNKPFYHIINPDEIDNRIKSQKPTLWNKIMNISKQNDNINELSENDDISDNDSNSSNDIINDKADINPNNIVFKILNTKLPDIYNLYIFENEEKNKLVKFDYALIPNIKISKYLNKIFKDNQDNISICIECKYSTIFKKWIPIKETTVEPYTLLDIEKTVENL